MVVLLSLDGKWPALRVGILPGRPPDGVTRVSLYMPALILQADPISGMYLQLKLLVSKCQHKGSFAPSTALSAKFHNLALAIFRIELQYQQHSGSAPI